MLHKKDEKKAPNEQAEVQPDLKEQEKEAAEGQAPEAETSAPEAGEAAAACETPPEAEKAPEGPTADELQQKVQSLEDQLLRKIAERCIPHRRFACFGSFTWAGAAVRRMTEFAEGMKWPVVGAPVELKQGYSTAVEPACRTLVDALVEDMKR